MSVDLALLLSASLVVAPTLIYPALGEALTEHSGVYNIGLEGIMAIAAATSWLAAAYTQSLLLGFLLGVMSGVLIGGVQAFFAVNLRADQIIFGLGIILLGPFLSTFMRNTAGQAVNKVPTLPLLDTSNLIYPLNVILKQNGFTYASIVLAFVIWIILFKTKFGLAVRAVGENPSVASATGINVTLMRYICSIVGSAIAAVGGVFLIVGLTGVWSADLTAGRGFIAIAMVRVGLFRPILILVSCLLFSFIDSTQLALQVTVSGLPHQIIQMIPYVMGVTALVISGRFKVFGGPASLGRPYNKEER